MNLTVRHKTKLSKILCQNRLKTGNMDNKQQSFFLCICSTSMCAFNNVLYIIYIHFQCPRFWNLPNFKKFQMVYRFLYILSKVCRLKTWYYIINLQQNNNLSLFIYYASYLLLDCIIIYLELFQMVLLLLIFRLLRYYYIGFHSPTWTIVL